jgi:5-methylcytosine-specific restriction endonuclease McrA
MAKNTPIDISYALRKWTPEEKQQVVDLRSKGHGPKKISKLTGFPIDQIRFWLYGNRQKKRQKRNKEASRVNSVKCYYRMKHNNWFSWKANCYRSTLVRVSNDRSEVPLKKELEDYLINGNKKCVYCEEELTQENIALDHNIPTARGGSSKIENLILCCNKCNMAKGSLSGSEYVDLLKCISNWEDAGRYLLGRLRGANRLFVRY